MRLDGLLVPDVKVSNVACNCGRVDSAVECELGAVSALVLASLGGCATVVASTLGLTDCSIKCFG